MTDKTKPPWWFHFMQWFVFTALIVFAVYNSLTDHGIQMAINCFCLGFIFFSMLARPLLDRRTKTMDALLADLKSAEASALEAARKFEQAIKDGYIEVIPITPDDQPPRQNRLH